MLLTTILIAHRIMNTEDGVDTDSQNTYESLTFFKITQLPPEDGFVVETAAAAKYYRLFGYKTLLQLIS